MLARRAESGESCPVGKNSSCRQAHSGATSAASSCTELPRAGEVAHSLHCKQSDRGGGGEEGSRGRAV